MTSSIPVESTIPLSISETSSGELGGVAHVEVLQDEVAHLVPGSSSRQRSPRCPASCRGTRPADRSRSTTVRNVMAVARSGGRRTSCSTSRPVDRTPTSAMLSAFENCAPPAGRGPSAIGGHGRRVEDPGVRDGALAHRVGDPAGSVGARRTRARRAPGTAASGGGGSPRGRAGRGALQDVLLVEPPQLVGSAAGRSPAPRRRGRGRGSAPRRSAPSASGRPARRGGSPESRVRTSRYWSWARNDHRRKSPGRPASSRAVDVEPLDRLADAAGRRAAGARPPAASACGGRTRAPPIARARARRTPPPSPAGRPVTGPGTDRGGRRSRGRTMDSGWRPQKRRTFASRNRS